MGQADAFLCGYTGTAVSPLAPSVDQIRIEDLAHSLAAMPRFSGHTERFYSVAQHSVWVSQHVPPEFALYGLIHDGPRSFLMDVFGPLKRDLVDYTSAERRLGFTIHEAFDLDPFLASNKLFGAIDDLALITEWRDLKQASLQWWNLPPEILSPLAPIEPLPPAEAEQLFLDRFHDIRAGRLNDQRYGAAHQVLLMLGGWRPPLFPHIQTVSGRVLDLLNPDPAQICIEDIAHALSTMPRFAGHTKVPYSVGQHSLFVSERCDPAEALWGLIHDGSETYVGDMASPIKPFFPAYRAAEHRLQSVIYQGLGIPPPVGKAASVKRADMLSADLEIRDLIDTSAGWWRPDLSSVANEAPIRVMAPAEVKERFLDRYYSLISKPQHAPRAVGP